MTFGYGLRSAAVVVALVVFLFVLAACGDGGSSCGEGASCHGAEPDADTTVTDGSGADIADVDDWLPEPICTDGTFWEYGTPAFREVTTEWGLEGVVGQTISLGDVDGDGYVDAFIRRGIVSSNDWSEDGVRRSWLLRNTGTGFEDVTRDSGLDDPRVARQDLGRPYAVAVFGDVDNDGDLDVYTGADTFDTTASRFETSEIMLNSGDGFFSFTPENNPIRRVGEIDSPSSASFVDADRDGRLDLWVPQQEYSPRDGGIVFPQDRFYRGGGDGIFVDITELAGLTTLPWDSYDDLNQARGHSRAWSAAACDLNGDGTTELLAASYGRVPNHLWQGTAAGDGGITFENRSVASGYAYDDDMTWEDNQFALCYCADHPDAEGCAGLPAPRVQCSPNWRHDTGREAFRLGGNSGATVCADLNNDGHMDLLTTELKHWWAGDGADQSSILLNTGAAEVTFDRPRRELLGFVVRHPSSPSWDEGHISATTLDFDNDGLPDFYIGAHEYAGNYGILYHQQQPEFWEEVPVEDGFEHNRSAGVAAADFDRDGDLDLLVGHSRQRCDDRLPNDCYPTEQVRLFENTLGDGGNWIQLALEGGARTNRSAIGARVTVTAGELTQTQEVGGGYGRSGAQNDLVLHFGLGTACEADVTVRWPNAGLDEQTFRVVSGYRYQVTQGARPQLVED